MDWFRMYTEARNDAKLRSLNDSQHRVWFNLLCFASEQQDRGTIDGYDMDLLAVEVASGDVDLLSETIQRLQRLRIIEVEGDTITFLNFAKRQYEKPSDKPEATRERKRRQRERDRNKCHTNVTPCHATDTDTETDTDTDNITTAVTREESQKAIVTKLQGAGILCPSPVEIEKIMFWADHGMEDDVIFLAIEKAALAGHRQVNYIEGILKRWLANGIMTMEQVQAEQQRYEDNKAKGGLKNGREPTKEFDFDAYKAASRFKAN